MNKQFFIYIKSVASILSAKNILLKSVLEIVAQLVNVIHRGRKTFLILFSVMFLTDNFKIHVVVYMKKTMNFIRALLKQHWDSPGKAA